jgi:serine/threonine protein kinase
MDDKSKEQENKELEDIKIALENRGYNYEILLGKGSYGRVVQAEHPVDNQKYAIKLLPIVHGDAAKYQKRELDVLTKTDLWQQNIVKYYSCWQMNIGNDPFLFIQMELCRVNLEAFVYRNEMGNAKIILAQGPPRFYRQVFPQILNGLDAMHSLGLVHRDIHISNILIANPKPTEIRQVNIKIADFGLAREIGSVIDGSPSLTEAPKLQRLSSGIGNELFRAPELATEHYDYKVDLYSAGIVLYFLSRYLEDKRQWKSEILALKNGERDREHLSHRDDKTLFSLITSLLEEDPKKRPSAEEALKIPWASTENIQSGKPTESTVPDGKQNAKKLIYIKIDGEVARLKRCVVNDDTFFGLKAGIESCTGINAECQDLHQETTINGKEEQIEIVSDLDVVCMFQSAEEAGKKVVIIVSESTLEMDVNYGSNPVALS